MRVCVCVCVCVSEYTFQIEQFEQKPKRTPTAYIPISRHVMLTPD